MSGEECERGDPLGMRGCELKGEAASHRIADEVELFERDIKGFGERRVAVAGKIVSDAGAGRKK